MCPWVLRGFPYRQSKFDQGRRKKASRLCYSFAFSAERVKVLNTFEPWLCDNLCRILYIIVPSLSDKIRNIWIFPYLTAGMSITNRGDHAR